MGMFKKYKGPKGELYNTKKEADMAFSNYWKLRPKEYARTLKGVREHKKFIAEWEKKHPKKKKKGILDMFK